MLQRDEGPGRVRSRLVRDSTVQSGSGVSIVSRSPGLRVLSTMRHVLTRFALASLAAGALLLLFFSCGGRISTLPPESDTSGWMCGNPDANPFPTDTHVVGGCTDAMRFQCLSWMRSLARTGYVFGTCLSGASGPDFATCYPGDRCFYNEEQGRDVCICGSGTNQVDCSGGRLCVSDTPDGPRRCVKPCSQ